MTSKEIRTANNRRARRALKVLQAYEKANDPGSGVDTAIVDLLADLMHWGSARRRHSAYDKPGVGTPPTTNSWAPWIRPTATSTPKSRLGRHSDGGR